MRISNLKELAELLKRYSHEALKVRFVTDGKAMFEFWARCTFAWCNAAIVAEETADVTNPSKAPHWWGLLIRKGRARGLSTIFALTQRPAESDKTDIGNATLLNWPTQAR